MYIDTSTRTGMERSLSTLLGIERAQLPALLKRGEFQLANGRILLEGAKRSAPPPDELLLFHLSRRLDGDADFSCRNLKELLTTENAFSAYLREHHVRFAPEGDRLVPCHRGRAVSLEPDPIPPRNRDIPYLRSRLGYNQVWKDFCCNGFALGDRVARNQYASILLRGPELLQHLASLLGDREIREDYLRRSHLYCLCYKLPMERVLFDRSEELAPSEKPLALLDAVASRLLDDFAGGEAHPDDFENPILRLKDDDSISQDCLIDKWEITKAMILN